MTKLITRKFASYNRNDYDNIERFAIGVYEQITVDIYGSKCYKKLDI